MTVHYDPMLSKLIAFGTTRDAAIARAVRALRDFPILGVRTNVAFLTHLLSHDAVRAGDVDTGFVERHLQDLTVAADVPDSVRAAAAFAAASRLPDAAHQDPWSQLDGWGR